MTCEAAQVELALLRDGASRVAHTLVDVEAHPGYPVLAGSYTTGVTRQRCAAARRTLKAAWPALMRLQAFVDTAEQIYPAELAQHLSTPSIEAGAEPNAAAKRS